MPAVPNQPLSAVSFAAPITAATIAASFRLDNSRDLLTADDAQELRTAAAAAALKQKRWTAYDSDDDGFDDDDDDEWDDENAHADADGGDSYDVGGLRQSSKVAASLQASLDTAPGVPAIDPGAQVMPSGKRGSAAADAAIASSGSGGSSSSKNRQPSSLRSATQQPKEHVLDKYANRIDLSLMEAKAATGVTRHTGRDDRATVEQVLDPRTRMILFKLLNAGVIASIHGCVSTGKEANVYHAFTPSGGEVAIKVYKTSILVFKDRDRYVSGEFRFKQGYSKSNPRKMVKLWAEKEMRNLKRLAAAGLPVPPPLLLRMHVLLMDFIGRDGVAAPRLKDAGLSPSKAVGAYGQVVRLMRRMYQQCRLVHADLSEYNM